MPGNKFEIILRDVHPRVAVSDKLNIPGWQILTNNGPPVMTGGVMPRPIHHSHARLLPQSSCWGEPVRLWDALATSLGPLIHTNNLQLLVNTVLRSGLTLTLTPSGLRPIGRLVGSILIKVEAQNQPLRLRGW